MAKQSVVKSPNGHGPAESAPLRDKGAARIVDRAPKPKRRRSPIARAELVTHPERETRRDRWNMRLLRRLGYQDWESSARHEVEFIDSAPELAAAIRSGYPRFAHVALAGYLARSDDVPDAEREVLRTVYPDMYEQFERKNGRVLRWYSAKQVFAGGADRARRHLGEPRARPSGGSGRARGLAAPLPGGRLHRLAPADALRPPAVPEHDLLRDRGGPAAAR